MNRFRPYSKPLQFALQGFLFRRIKSIFPNITRIFPISNLAIQESAGANRGRDLVDDG